MAVWHAVEDIAFQHKTLKSTPKEVCFVPFKFLTRLAHQLYVENHYETESTIESKYLFPA